MLCTNSISTSVGKNRLSSRYEDDPDQPTNYSLPPSRPWTVPWSWTIYAELLGEAPH